MFEEVSTFKRCARNLQIPTESKCAYNIQLFQEVPAAKHCARNLQFQIESEFDLLFFHTLSSVETAAHSYALMYCCSDVL